MDYEVYKKERDLLIDAEREAARSFDKTMITLSAGALVLSFGFVRDMQVSPSCRGLLYCAWSAFALSLQFVLLSFLLSQKAMRRQRDIIDECLESEMSSAPQVTRWAKVIGVLNWGSLISLILGVVLFACFAACNLFRSDTS
jgi:hypothetical protein